MSYDQMNLSDLSNASESVKRLNAGLLRPSIPISEPDTPEKRLHEQILEACRQRGWICFHGSTAHRSRRTIGEPDCIVIADGGRFFLVEVKSKSGKLRPEQAALAAWARRLGHEIHLCRSLDQFLTLVSPVTASTNLASARS